MIAEHDRRDGHESWTYRPPEWWERGDITHENLKAVLGRDYRSQIGKALFRHNAHLPNGLLHTWFYPPKPHLNSQNRYLLEYKKGDDIIYIGVMPPYQESSTHRHPLAVFEEYYSIRGVLFVNGEPISEGFVVLPDVEHHASTREAWALTLIIARNLAKFSPERRHIYSGEPIPR